ncbi:MAG: hypothetical protein MJ055_03285, partial [Phascolarctobacterium sp.]|nr:hypothetical protein [Phascolarctobacterium sp.]
IGTNGVVVTIKGDKILGQRVQDRPNNMTFTVEGLENQDSITMDANAFAKLVDPGYDLGRHLTIGTGPFELELAPFLRQDGTLVRLLQPNFDSDNYEVTTRLEYRILPNDTAQISSARYGGGWNNVRTPMMDISYLDVKGTGISLDYEIDVPWVNATQDYELTGEGLSVEQ